MEYLSAIVRNEILPFPAAWMALEVIVLKSYLDKNLCFTVEDEIIN